MPLIGVVTVTSKIGLHARPAARLVQGLQHFESDVFLEKDGDKVNAKSIIGVLTLAAGHGAELTLYVDGPDAEACLAFVTEFFASAFGENDDGT